MEYLRLKEILKEKGVTGKELAEKVGVTANTISFIVTGKNYPSFDLLIKIAETLNVDIKDLFNSTKSNDKVYLIIKNELHTFDSVEVLKEYVNEL